MIRGIGRFVMLGALLCACDSTGPSDDTVLAATLGEITTAEVRLPAGLGRATAPEVGAGGAVPHGCPYVAASAMFVCPQSNFPGITVLRSYQLLDANGGALSKFERSTVAAIKVMSSVSDSITNSLVTFTYATSSTFTLSGLLGGTHVINGVAATNASFVLSGSGKTRTTSVMQTVANVEPAPTVNLTGGFPNAGTVTSVITGVDTSGTTLVPTNVVTTFNGTNIVAIQVQQSGVTVVWQCQYFKSSDGVNLVACSKP